MDDGFLLWCPIQVTENVVKALEESGVASRLNRTSIYVQTDPPPTPHTRDAAGSPFDGYEHIKQKVSEEIVRLSETSCVICSSESDDVLSSFFDHTCCLLCSDGWIGCLNRYFEAACSSLDINDLLTRRRLREDFLKCQ